MKQFQSTPVAVSAATGTDALVSALAAGSNAGTARVRVVAAALTIAGTTAGSIKFQSHTTTGNASGVFAIAGNGSLVLPYNPDGWFISSPGEGLDGVVTGATVSGTINVVQV